MKRIRDEDGSRFNNFQILNNRYALLNLLGKGGFSEVYKVRTLASFYFLRLNVFAKHVWPRPICYVKSLEFLCQNWQLWKYIFLQWSEVRNFRQAYDLVEHRYVACKLHGLNAQWSEDKKQSYIRHAIREYNIHKTLVHHHIVRLWDIFEIDQNTFCTILEYCSGT